MCSDQDTPLEVAFLPLTLKEENRRKEKVGSIEQSPSICGLKNLELVCWYLTTFKIREF